MQSFRTVAQVSDDRTLTVVMPAEFPKGQVQVTVTAVNEADLPYTRGEVAGIPYTRGRQPRTSLAEWAKQNAEHWGTKFDQMMSKDLRDGRFDRSSRSG
jgi:hypothetical protein